MLQLLKLGFSMRDGAGFPFVDPPSVEALEQTLTTLRIIGGLVRNACCAPRVSSFGFSLELTIQSSKSKQVQCL